MISNHWILPTIFFLYRESSVRARGPIVTLRALSGSRGNITRKE